jgi:hypothetical protein
VMSGFDLQFPCIVLPDKCQIATIVVLVIILVIVIVLFIIPFN